MRVWRRPALVLATCSDRQSKSIAIFYLEATRACAGRERISQCLFPCHRQHIVGRNRTAKREKSEIRRCGLTLPPASDPFCLSARSYNWIGRNCVGTKRSQSSLRMRMPPPNSPSSVKSKLAKSSGRLRENGFREPPPICGVPNPP